MSSHQTKHPIHQIKFYPAHFTNPPPKSTIHSQYSLSIMRFTKYASMFILGIFVPATLAMPASNVGGTCESGLDHNINTSCHGNVGEFACSGNDRSYILQCQGSGNWGVYQYCPSGTGCHNCGCAPGY